MKLYTLPSLRSNTTEKSNVPFENTNLSYRRDDADCRTVAADGSFFLTKDTEESWRHMDQISDAELMRRILEKERQALEQLYDRYARLVYSFALKSTRSEHQAKEIVQLVFTRLWTTEKGFDPMKGRFVNWLITITRNITIDYLRKERRHSEVIALDSGQWEHVSDGRENDPSETVPPELIKQQVRNAYRHLSESQAALIEQLYWQGYTLSEIARMNNEPLGTVKSRLHQSLKILRKHLLGEMED